MRVIGSSLAAPLGSGTGSFCIETAKKQPPGKKNLKLFSGMKKPLGRGAVDGGGLWWVRDQSS